MLRTRLTLGTVLTLGLTGLLTVFPVLTPVWAAPQPVAPSLHRYAVSGVDPAALAQAPRAFDPAALAASGITGPVGPTARVAATRAPALLSSPLATGRFTTAGVSWMSSGAPAGVVVQVRVREKGAWTDWQQLETADGPDAGTTEAAHAGARVSTEPISTVDGDGIQVRVDSAGSAAPRDVSILTVDPGTSAADANLGGLPGNTAHSAAVTDQPSIVTRAQWGADESLRDCAPTYMRTLRVGFVHHTVGTNSYAPADSAGLVRGIYAYHVMGNGWCDVGYNFLVDRFGRIFEGRFGGLDKPVLGAHTLAFNWNSFGVAAMGTFSTDAAPAVMTQSISAVLGWKLGLYGRNPGGRDVLTSAGGAGARWPAGTTITFDVVSGHRDAYSTECPGNVLYGNLPGIRLQAYQYLMAHTRSQENFYGILGTTAWAPSGKVEFHVQSQASNYSRRLADAMTLWTAGQPEQWRFLIGSSSGDTRPDLIGVHLTGTRSGKVEVIETSWASGYRDTDVVTVTPMAAFTPDVGGQVTVGGPSGGDLYFVLSGSTASGKTEVHALSASSDYTQWSVHSTTALPSGLSARDARFLVSRGTGNLYVVLHQGTSSGQSELHALSRSSGFGSFFLHAALPTGYTSDPTVQWMLGTGSSPTLVMAQVMGTGTSKVEVHTLSPASGYRSWTLHSATDLPQIAYPAWQVAMG